ncbi:MAG: Ig-like domain-containing protein [Candidatus Roizmanbacteria bacterium]|nr:Ig-like domain-containing protein [Candidatus Roizmanbacteria bacterium]
MSTWGLRKIHTSDQDAKIQLTVPDGYRCKDYHIVRTKNDLDTNTTTGDSARITTDECYIEFGMEEAGNLLVFEIEPEGPLVCSDLRYGTITSPTDGSTFTRTQNITVSGTATDWSSTSDPGITRVDVYKGTTFIASIPVNESTGAFSGQIAATALSNTGGDEQVALNLFAILNDTSVCDNWQIGTTINVTITNSAPTTGNFSILSSSGSTVCTNSACNSVDVIEASTQTTSTALRVRATFTDTDPVASGSNMDTDIKNGYIIFDNNNSGSDGWFYRINYLDNGSVSITEDGTGSYASKLSLSNATATFPNATTVQIDATISLSSLDYEGSLGPFFSNVYLNAIDYGNAGSGRVIKTGADTGWSTVSQSGNYPWQMNGIGASWTSEVSSITYYCNGNSCWTYDRNANMFGNGGKPFTMSSSYSSAPAVAGTYMWSNNGPTSAWENLTADINYICNGQYCWSYSGGSWSSITLSSASGWSSMPAYGGRYIWTSGGPTVGWNNPLNNEMNVCNGDYCWKIDSSTMSLVSNFRPSTSWSVTPYSLGGQSIYPWSNGGITTAWTSYVADLIYVCNGPICWSYNPSTNSWGSPYTLPSQATGLDIWNGRGVSVWANQVPTGNIVVSSPQMAWSLTAGCSYAGTSATFTDSGSGTITLPYAHYGGNSACLFTAQGGQEGYYLTTMSIPWQGSTTSPTSGSYATGIIRGGASHNMLPADFGFTDNAPSLESDALSISGSVSGGSPSCIGSACDGIDVIGDLDSTTAGGYDKKILFTARIVDPETSTLLDAPPPASKRSDIKTAVFSIRIGATTVASLTYTDSENGSFSTSQTGNSTYLTTSSPFSGVTSSRSGDTLIVNFVFDMSTIRGDQGFEGDLFLSGTDFAGATVSATEVVSNVPFWDGSSVLIRFQHNNAGGYIPTSPSLLVTYPSGCLTTGTQTTITLPTTSGTNSGTYTLPYAHANGSNTCLITIRSSRNGYYLTSADMSNVGGAVINAANGTVSNASISVTGYGNATYTIPVTVQDTQPSNTSLTVYGNDTGVGGTSCTNATCNSQDIIEDIDTDHDKEIRITASVTDPENASPFPASVPPSNKSADISSMVITVRDAVAGVNVFHVTYTDPTSSASPATTMTATIDDSSYFLAGTTAADLVTTATASVAGNVLSVPFVVDLSKIRSDKSFRASVTINSTDFAGATTGTITPFSQLGVWNGITVSMVFRHNRIGNFTPSATAQLTVTDVNDCLDQLFPADPAYNNPVYTVNLTSVGNDSTPITLPYYSAIVGETCPITITSNTDGYYLTSLDLTEVGGAASVTCANGTCGNGTTSLQISIGDVTDTNRIVVANMQDTSPSFTSITGGAFSIQNANADGVSNETCIEDQCENINLITHGLFGDSGGTSDSTQKYDKIVRFTIRVKDPENLLASYTPPSNKHSDLSRLRITLSRSDNYAEAFSLEYQSPAVPDNANDYTFTSAYDSDTFDSNPIPDTPTVVFEDDILRISFNVHLDTIKKDPAFLGRVSLLAVDQAGSQVEASNFVNGLDFWNGRDVHINGAYRELIAHYSNEESTCPPMTEDVAPDISIDQPEIYASYYIRDGGGNYVPWSYDGNTLGGAVRDIVRWDLNPFQPYVYYEKTVSGTVSPYIILAPTSNSTYYFYAANFEAYGTPCVFADGDGTIKTSAPVQFGAGGAQVLNPPATIFIIRVGDAWIQSAGIGSIFSFTAFNMDIPFTCLSNDSECYASSNDPAEGNGMVFTNGILSGSTSSADRYGYPFNWYASSDGSTRPSNKPTITAMMNFPTYGWLTNFLDNAGLLDSGMVVKRTLTEEMNIGGSVNTDSNTLYLFEMEIGTPTVMITENITVPDDAFRVYVIRGNLEIAAGVTQIEGIYIVDGDIMIRDEGAENLQPYPDATEVFLQTPVSAGGLGQLKITGTMIASGQINILRSLGAANNYHPPVIFEYDVAQMHNFIDNPTISSYFPLYTNAQGEE